MAQFSYKARRRTGEVVQGVLDVADCSGALIQIERLGLFPVAVEAAKGGAASTAKVSGAKRDFSALLPQSVQAHLKRHGGRARAAEALKALEAVK